MLVGDWAGTVVEWKDALDGLQAQIGPALGRWKRAYRQDSSSRAYFLVRSARGAGCWPKRQGLERPYRMQSLLGRSRWSAAALLERVRDYAIAALGMDRRPRALSQSQRARRGGLRHQTGHGARDDFGCTRCGPVVCLGSGGFALWIGLCLAANARSARSALCVGSALQSASALPDRGRSCPGRPGVPRQRIGWRGLASPVGWRRIERASLVSLGAPATQLDNPGQL